MSLCQWHCAISCARLAVQEWGVVKLGWVRRQPGGGRTEDAAVIKMEPIQLDGGVAIGVMVELPQTRQLTISTSKGYIAAGYMDLPFLQQRRPERHIIAARVLDVR